MNINGQDGRKEEKLKKKVADEPDNAEDAELLYRRYEGAEPDGEDSHLDEEVLRDGPTLPAQSLSHADLDVKMRRGVGDRFGDDENVLQTHDDHQIRKDLLSVEGNGQTKEEADTDGHAKAGEHGDDRTKGNPYLGLDGFDFPHGEVNVEE